MALGFGLLLVVAPLVSAEVRFVYRGGWELLRIQWRATSITTLLQDPALDSATRSQLTLVLDARSFAVDSLALNADKSFTRYVDVGRDTLVLVLSASPHDRLAAYTWWFPITGRVAYHGYYSLAAAEHAAARFAERGYDTYLRTAGAFSTLGWLPDPLFSTSLGPGPWIAATVMHELAHNTIWITGETQFSESLAELIGYRGAEQFFRSRGDTANARLMDRAWQQRRVTSRIQMALVTALRDALADGRTPEEREARRSAAFAAADSSIQSSGINPGRALRVAIAEYNNAAVIAAGLYHGDLDGLEALYQSCGGILAAVIAVVRTAVDPSSARCSADAVAPAGTSSVH